MRQGFTSKDGWRIDFDHVYVTLADVTAYQTDPPYDASTGVAPESETAVSVEETMTFDLAAGDENAEPILISSVEVPAGQFNALSWRMVNATEGDAAGHTVVMDGMAEKDGEMIDFVIFVDDSYQYDCGEFVGDSRKGIVAADSTADIEATFHFDHIFGDGDAPADDSLNVGALGFDPLAALAEGGELNVTMGDLASQLSDEDFATFIDTLGTLGHVGEGHCYESETGYTGDEG